MKYTRRSAMLINLRIKLGYIVASLLKSMKLNYRSYHFVPPRLTPKIIKQAYFFSLNEEKFPNKKVFK